MEANVRQGFTHVMYKFFHKVNLRSVMGTHDQGDSIITPLVYKSMFTVFLLAIGIKKKWDLGQEPLI